MYNAERKEKYLYESSFSNNPTCLSSIFRTTEPYEQTLGVDLCAMSPDDLQAIFDQEFGYKSKPVEDYMSLLKKYIVWSQEQGYPICEDLLSFKPDMRVKMQRYMVSSPAHLEKILNMCFTPLSSETIDCLYRCYFWMAFSGLPEEEVVKVAVNEINLSTNTIEHNGESYPIDPEAVPAFRMGCEAEQFLFIHPKYQTYRKRFDGPYLMRGVRNARMSLKSLQNVKNIHMAKKKIALTYDSISLSGMFYRAYMMEKDGHTVNFDTYSVEYALQSIQNRNSKRDLETISRQVRYLISRDYANWKMAFNKK